MRVNLITSLVLTSALTAACSQLASPTSPTSNAQASVSGDANVAAVVSGAAVTELPFTGRLDGTYQGSGAPPLITVHLEAEGNATHLGRFTFDSVHVVNFANFTGAGTAELVAANGDRLTTTLTGVATPQDAPGVFFIVETYTVTGGTGRFAGATGRFVLERLSYASGPDTGTSSGAFEGILSLPHGSH